MAAIIDPELCTACGVCTQVCPRFIPETTSDGVTSLSHERAELCIDCGHCAAVCPADAISIPVFGDSDFPPVGQVEIDEDRLLTLLRQRRSVRLYRDRPVPREIINRMIDAARCSPTGTGRGTTGVIVIDDKKTLAALSEHIYKMYEDLEKALSNPVARFFIKRQGGEKTLRVLQGFVMPGMHWYIRWYREGRSDEILRDCPALMLFHSPVFEPSGDENCLLAAFHAVVMAETMDMGTCLNGLILPVFKRIPEARELINLPVDREVHASITLGFSKYPFRRVVPRDLEEVRYLS